ncbi:MAG: enoyl-CoA hydratase/isomerase family protein [gamma proteobacterium symbiont of Bathyaustriella thionipta]|nr:enoyl-CoA hydratase/isomerase family protein [gamma proteobacterium symbiont of Bathyaustriella thionipta]MCU7950195.1 enoyl-CoA hydratase/isomerase family protein [gamma proteobacterium symbiont of Bathyaustriella thionipta]MCU7954922.1 enoyl-CoA hydratase/isomerase family protein [gamma proteobacterium symbiont of Bathyaustriella thionipta]MCU7957203.1 enoyl-CoA hydratase/isomerase family protein [gamma proteobacterium symbiont of Bathyaustriella thionipta]MCU7968362.1 enoyl-CoA hydratase/
MNDYSNYDSDVFSCTYEGQTAVICFKSESFIMAMNASKMHELLECLNAIEVDNNIKGLLTLHASEYERVAMTQEFIKSIQDKSGYVQKEMGVTRYGNSVKRLTLAINEFSKPSVVGLHGQVAIDSFGWFLACDYRIASGRLSIEFPALELGVVPAGAVSFFMKRQLGATKTMEILMGGRTILADEAKELCLVSELTDKDQLKASCMAKLEEFYKVPGASTLNLTKQLLRPKTYELEEHFEMSSRLMWNSIIDA